MVFGFLKKKKDPARLEMPLPPEEKISPIGDFPSIRPSQELPAPKENFDEFPELMIPESHEDELPMPPRPEDLMKDDLPPPPSHIFEEEHDISPEMFDKTINEELPRPIIRSRLKPIFVGVDEYSKISEDSNVIRAKLLEADEFVKHLNHLKTKEEDLLKNWRSRVEDIDKKLNFVDELVSKAQR